MNRFSTLAFHVYDKVTNNRHRIRSGLDFQDVSPPQAFPMSPYTQMPDEPKALPGQVYPKPLNLQRNKSERNRLQGIVQRRVDSCASDSSRSNGHARSLTDLFNNEGGRRTFFAIWLLLHALVFAFGFVHYWLKGELPLSSVTRGCRFRPDCFETGR